MLVLVGGGGGVADGRRANPIEALEVGRSVGLWGYEFLFGSPVDITDLCVCV